MTRPDDPTDEKLTELADNWRDGLTGDEVKALIAGCRRAVSLESQLSTLTRLATAVVSTANTFVRQSSLDHAEAIDALASFLDRGSP